MKTTSKMNALFLTVLLGLVPASMLLTGCPQTTDAQNNGDNGGGEEQTINRTPNSKEITVDGNTITVTDRTLLGTQPAGTVGLVTQDIASKIQAAFNAALSNNTGDAEAARRLLGRGLEMFIRDTNASEGITDVNRADFSAYIGWIRAQTPATLWPMLDAAIRQTMYPLDPQMINRTPNSIPLTLDNGKNVALTDSTHIGTQPYGTTGMVTPEITAKFQNAINAVIASGDEKAMHVLARDLGITINETLGSGFSVVNKAELSVYINWIKQQTPESLRPEPILISV